MKDLVIGCATVGQPTNEDCMASWNETSSEYRPLHIVYGRTLMDAYQMIYDSNGSPIQGYIHDDVYINERFWDDRVLQEFKDPNVGVVGFGGALGHGDLDMYQKPYQLVSLARRQFYSNMRNAEQNGSRFTGAMDVVVLDGFALFVRKEILNRQGGWPVNSPVGYFMYSEWLCLVARRQGYRIRLVGVACDHLSGRSTGLGPAKMTGEDFEAAHRWIYDNFRDVLPADVPQERR